ncbi:uncharacterized protein LOC126897969 [Daktulosphaira vitifoliae]|uniref:uncharacterized protein LOC126897969 n=1 Tax=Daktulosphaira vitifoliae TaxID=58002 RepID=UPI0021AA9A1C|nr:uncharacterized protein LOC126897969 [Daktulosphaira vitifoliae]
MEDGVVVQQSTVIKQHVHPQWNVTLKDSNLAFLIIEPRFVFPAPLGQMRFVEESDLPMKTKRDFPFKSYSTQNKEELVTIYYNGNRCPVLIDGKLQNETMWHLFLCSPHNESTHIKLCADDIGGIVYKSEYRHKQT